MLLIFLHTFLGGLITVREATGTVTLIEMDDPNPVDVKYISFSGWQGNTAIWNYSCASKRKSKFDIEEDF